MGSRMLTSTASGFSENLSQQSPSSACARRARSRRRASKTSTRCTAARKRPAARRAHRRRLVRRACRLALLPRRLLVANPPAHAEPVVVGALLGRADEARARIGARREVSDVRRRRRRAVEAVGINVRVAVNRRVAAGPGRVALVLGHAAVVACGQCGHRLYAEPHAARPRVLRVGRRTQALLVRAEQRLALLVLEPARARLRVVDPRVALPAAGHVEDRLVRAARAAASRGVGLRVSSPFSMTAPQSSVCGRPAQSSAAVAGAAVAAGVVVVVVDFGGGAAFDRARSRTLLVCRHTRGVLLSCSC